ncbi:MAG TPA: hypothetical protein VGJ50_02125 [Streptosporangiaceae bacterium]
MPARPGLGSALWWISLALTTLPPGVSDLACDRVDTPAVTDDRAAAVIVG